MVGRSGGSKVRRSGPRRSGPRKKASKPKPRKTKPKPRKQREGSKKKVRAAAKGIQKVITKQKGKKSKKSKKGKHVTKSKPNLDTTTVEELLMSAEGREDIQLNIPKNFEPKITPDYFFGETSAEEEAAEGELKLNIPDDFPENWPPDNFLAPTKLSEIRDIDY